MMRFRRASKLNLLKHNDKTDAKLNEASHSLVEAELTELIAKLSNRQMPLSKDERIQAQTIATITDETTVDAPLTTEEICKNATEEWSKLSKILDGQCRDNVEETWLQAKLKGEMPFLTHKQDRLKNCAFTKPLYVRPADTGDSISASADLVEFSADYRTFADLTTPAKQWNSADKFHECKKHSSLEFQLAIASILAFILAIIVSAVFICSHNRFARKLELVNLDNSELELVYHLEDKWKFRNHH